MSTAQGLTPKMMGRFVGALIVTGVTKDQNGLFSTVSNFSADLHVGTTLGGMTYRLTSNLVDTSPTDIFLEDNVAESGGFEVTVTEIRTAANVPITEGIALGGFGYFRVQRNYLPPGATNPQVFVAICAISDFDGGDLDKGPHKCVLSGKSAGVSPILVAAGGSIPF